jgi:hypothetical protein
LKFGGVRLVTSADPKALGFGTAALLVIPVLLYIALSLKVQAAT